MQGVGTRQHFSHAQVEKQTLQEEDTDVEASTHSASASRSWFTLVPLVPRVLVGPMLGPRVQQRMPPTKQVRALGTYFRTPVPWQLDSPFGENKRAWVPWAPGPFVQVSRRPEAPQCLLAPHSPSITPLRITTGLSGTLTIPSVLPTSSEGHWESKTMGRPCPGDAAWVAHRSPLCCASSIVTLGSVPIELQWEE